MTYDLHDLRKASCRADGVFSVRGEHDGDLGGQKTHQRFIRFCYHTAASHNRRPQLKTRKVLLRMDAQSQVVTVKLLCISCVR